MSFWQPVRPSRRFALVGPPGAAPPRGAVPQPAPHARPPAGAPWASAQREHLRSVLGESPDAAVAAELITRHLTGNTYESYGRFWSRFAAYCDSQGLQTLPAAPAAVVCYIAHLYRSGTSKPQSVKNHLSAINKAHTDLGFAEPAVGGLVAAVRRGWALEVHADPRGQSDQRVGLPASVASRCLDMVSRSPPLSAVTQRPFLYVAFGFALMARSDTDIHLQRGDVETTPSSIFVRLRSEKGRATLAERRRLEFPKAAVPGLYDAVRAWQQAQLASFARAGRSCPPETSFWRLPSDSAAWTSASAVCSGWIAFACSALGAEPPAGELWSSHSLRIGAASAANALDVNLLKIKDWGGWALASGAVMRYIRPVIADAAAQRFFGWMRSPADLSPRPASR